MRPSIGSTPRSVNRLCGTSTPGIDTGTPFEARSTRLLRITATCSMDGHRFAHSLRMHRIDTYGILAEEMRNKFASREQTVRLLISERLEEHGIDEREDSSIGADADCE